MIDKYSHINYNTERIAERIVIDASKEAFCIGVAIGLLGGIAISVILAVAVGLA